MRTNRKFLAIATAMVVVLAACGSDDDSGTADTTADAPADSTAASEAPSDTAGSPETTEAATSDTTGDTAGDAAAPADGVPTELGEGEGEVNLIAWAGYVEDGSTDPAVDWVSDFEADTGCQVNVKVGNSSDEMVQLMQTGEYDGVSASGDATQRLIAGGEVAPINPDLIPNYADVFEDLKLQPWNSVDGVPYGVPHGRGANLLVFNTELYTTPPDSWSEVFEDSTAAPGAVSVYDSPIYIADAALYLMATQPDLGITNPYALDQDQFDAAIALLDQQQGIVGQYWAAVHRPAGRARGRQRPRRDDLAGDRQPRPGQRRDDRRRQAGRGCHRMVGHVDDLVAGQEPQLHVHVDGSHRIAGGERRGRRVVR